MCSLKFFVHYKVAEILPFFAVQNASLRYMKYIRLHRQISKMGDCEDGKGKPLFLIYRGKMLVDSVMAMDLQDFGTFLLYKTFLSPQRVSGSYKNSYRKLRMYTL